MTIIDQNVSMSLFHVGIYLPSKNGSFETMMKKVLDCVDNGIFSSIDQM